MRRDIRFVVERFKASEDRALDALQDIQQVLSDYQKLRESLEVLLSVEDLEEMEEGGSLDVIDGDDVPF